VSTTLPATPRLRLFAGPNGSGKSTLVRSVLRPELLGVYVNPDDIQAAIRRDGWLDLSAYRLSSADGDPIAFLRASTFLADHGFAADADRLTLADGRIAFTGVTVNAYHASVLADFVRRALLARRISFTFESVMSSPDKVEFLREARAAGYRVYLYYIATEDPEINLSRVRNRAKLGEHDVPPNKIVARYHRSLQLLPWAIADGAPRLPLRQLRGRRRPHLAG